MNTAATDAELDDQMRLIITALERRRRRRDGDEPRPANAIALARAYGIRPDGSRDSRKRGVRVVVKALRDAGVPIVSTGAGYWLAETAEDHALYQATLTRLGIAHLAEARRDRTSAASEDVAGQLSLF